MNLRKIIQSKKLMRRPLQVIVADPIKLFCFLIFVTKLGHFTMNYFFCNKHKSLPAKNGKSFR